MNKRSFIKSAIVTAFITPFVRVWGKDRAEPTPEQIPVTDFEPTPCPPGMVPYTLQASVAAIEGQTWPKDIRISSYILQASTPEGLLYINVLNTAFVMVAQEISMGLTPEEKRWNRIKELVASVQFRPKYE